MYRFQQNNIPIRLDINDHINNLLIAADDQKSFRKLMELTADELLNFAIGFLSDKEVAEEIVSDVYVRIWENRSQISNIKNLKSYLFISVKNGCLSHLRKTKKERIISLDEYDEYKDFTFPTLSNPESELISKEAIAQIYKVIESLPPKCKIAFTLAKINGLKHKEIAEIMNISEKTVNNHLVSAVKKITEALGAGHPPSPI